MADKYIPHTLSRSSGTFAMKNAIPQPEHLTIAAHVFGPDHAIVARFQAVVAHGHEKRSQSAMTMEPLYA
jgi:hypothetical protein